VSAPNPVCQVCEARIYFDLDKREWKHANGSWNIPGFDHVRHDPVPEKQP
jgi:hypothetical protein